MKVNSIPSHIELIEESFMSPIPKEFTLNNLKPIRLITYIVKKTINIAKILSVIKSIVLIFLYSRPKVTIYIMPDMANIINLFSLISMVFISSLDIENKIHESIRVKNIFIFIILY